MAALEAKEKSPYQIQEPIQRFYACRKCGTQLFNEDYIDHGEVKANHSRGRGITTSASDRGSDSRSSEQPQVNSMCSSVFLGEAPSWVENTSEHHGKILCPKCASRVGSFSWSGLTCSCGQWVTPAFQFQLSRVEPRGGISLSDLIPPPK